MPTFYEFFAGAGLARLGLEPDWSCAWANDNDPKKQDVYTHNFGAGHFVLGDVSMVAPPSLPPGADLAWASFPCVDLSLAGWQRGMLAGRSGTFWAFWRIMRDLHDSGRRPPIIVIENVVGLLSHDDFRGLCEALAALHMKFGALVIDAKRFLPQSRPRVFIVAVDADAPIEYLTTKAPIDDTWIPNGLQAAQRRLPDQLMRSWRWWKLPTPPPRARRLVEDIEDVPANSDMWSSAEYTRRLLDMMTPLHAEKVTRRQRMLTDKTDRAVGALYRRTRNGVQRAEARFDDVAGCLRTPKGGSSCQTLLIITRDAVRSRLLTPREAARLMGVPDTFWLPSSYNDAYMAMGDAVAVPAVSWLSQNLLLPIAQAIHVKRQTVDIAPPTITALKRIEKHRRRAELLAARWEALA
jgi:DNA (cytosine-5)-methyltransferase 1